MVSLVKSQGCGDYSLGWVSVSEMPTLVVLDKLDLTQEAACACVIAEGLAKHTGGVVCTRKNTHWIPCLIHF